MEYSYHFNKKTYLLTSARGNFGLWRMAKKIKTCSDVESEKNNIDIGSSYSVVFDGAKGKSNGDLDVFNSNSDGDEGQKP